MTDDGPTPPAPITVVINVPSGPPPDRASRWVTLVGGIAGIAASVAAVLTPIVASNEDHRGDTTRVVIIDDRGSGVPGLRGR